MHRVGFPTVDPIAKILCMAKASAGHSSQFQVTKSFFILSIVQGHPIGIEYVTAIAGIMSETEKGLPISRMGTTEVAA